MLCVEVMVTTAGDTLAARSAKFTTAVGADTTGVTAAAAMSCVPALTKALTPMPPTASIATVGTMIWRSDWREPVRFCGAGADCRSGAAASPAAVGVNEGSDMVVS